MMKFIVALLLIVILHQTGFPQQDYKKINISKDIQLIKLSENAYVDDSYASLTDFGRVSSNGLIFINGNEAFLFDTPCTDSLTMVLVSWLKDSLHLKITGFVPNHWHVDCMGGLGYLQKLNIPSYANQITIDMAKIKNLLVPEHGFRDSLQIQLGDQFIQCFYLGAAHSMDNIVVWIPSEQILFAGCMIKSAESRNLGNVADGDLVAYPKTIDKLVAKFPKARIVIPGHGSFGGFELLKHTKELTTR